MPMSFAEFIVGIIFGVIAVTVFCWLTIQRIRKHKAKKKEEALGGEG